MKKFAWEEPTVRYNVVCWGDGSQTKIMKESYEPEPTIKPKRIRPGVYV